MLPIEPRSISTFADDVPLLCEPLLRPEPVAQGPELHDGGLHPAPSATVNTGPAGELVVVVGQPALGGTPSHHQQHQVRAGLLSVQMPGVRDERVGEEGEGGKGAHNDRLPACCRQSISSVFPLPRLQSAQRTWRFERVKARSGRRERGRM